MTEAAHKPVNYVGVDLGGTKILTGVFDAHLRRLGKLKLSTKAERGPAAVLERVARGVREAVDECDLDFKSIKAVGIGAPGACDSENGRVIFAPNLGWENVPLKDELEQHLGLPVFLENDCNIATLGVYEVELAARPRHMIGVFLGTGIGGGLILEGNLYSGFNRTAGEVGHMIVQAGGPKCACGNRGCFEALAGRAALFRKIQAAVKDGQQTVLTDMLGPDLEDMRSGDLRKAIRRGDGFVEKLVKEAAHYTGLALGNLINIFNPEVVVIGGGLIHALEDEMLPIIVETAFDCAMAGTTKGIQIVPSKLADNAGIVGAAVLARMRTK
ncbi:MAG: ROK family protein [Verrucomicrobia bacterium]|nr:ROK family protein [Verrucomicrobiota bacterium]